MAAVLSLLALSPQSAQNSPQVAVTPREALRGLEISPVPLNMKGKNPNRVGLGSYIVNAQGLCADCHSCPTYKGINPFTVGGSGIGPITSPGPINPTNYLAGGVPFGTVTSRNLTPDTSGKPAGLTLPEFITTIRSGRDQMPPHAILQVMPWPILRHMTDNDLSAIYEFLSAIPPAQPGACTGPGETGQ